eukprot:3069584-Ditylum_brightwellii.AAC.1
MGFTQCQADQCVFKKDEIIIIVYIDDCLVFADSKEESDAVVEELNKNFDTADEGKSIEQYLGVKIDDNNGGTF